MERFRLAMAVGVMAILSPACGARAENEGTGGSYPLSSAGKEVSDPGLGLTGVGGTAGGGGADGFAGQAEGVAAGGVVGLPPCPNGEEGDYIVSEIMQCRSQSLTPDPDGETVPCEIPLLFEVRNFNQVVVFVDCVIVHHCDQDTECWDLVVAEESVTIVFDDALCSRLQQDGFTRIDIGGGCSSHDGLV